MVWSPQLLPPVDNFTHHAMALQSYARLAGELHSMLRWKAYKQTCFNTKVFRTSLDASVVRCFLALSLILPLVILLAFFLHDRERAVSALTIASVACIRPQYTAAERRAQRLVWTVLVGMLLASHLQLTSRRNVKVSRLQSLPAQSQLEAWSRCCKFCAQRETSQVATVLLSTLLLAAPAFARASSSEYISVQDRVRQRSPLQKKQSAGLIDSVETAPDPQLKALSIPQQAGQIYNFAVSQHIMHRCQQLMQLQVAEVQQLSAAAVDAIAAADYAQVQ